MRGKNLIKFFKTIELLSRPGGSTIDELKDALGVDRRSVYRQISLVEGFGFPVYEDRDREERKKRWKLLDDYVRKLPNMKLPDLRLGLPEITALYLIKGEAKVYKGTEIEKNADSALSKLGLFVPGGFNERLERIKTLSVASSRPVKDYSGKDDVLDALTGAVLERMVCVIRYDSFASGGTKTIKVEPLNFFENDGGLYFFARVVKYGDIRTFAAERVLSVEATGERFEYPKGFDPEGLLSRAFDIIYDDPIEAEIWFGPDEARYIRERLWAKDQVIVESKGGSVVLKLKTSGLNGLKRWVLSFGKGALVLGPERLKTEVANELKAGAALYSGRRGGRPSKRRDTVKDGRGI